MESSWRACSAASGCRSRGLVACGGDDDKQTPPRSIAWPCPWMPSWIPAASSYKCENGRKFTVQYLNRATTASPSSAGQRQLDAGLRQCRLPPSGKYALGRRHLVDQGQEATLYGDWKGGEPTDGVACKGIEFDLAP